jgi:hypothetical protein
MNGLLNGAEAKSVCSLIDTSAHRAANGGTISQLLQKSRANAGFHPLLPESLTVVLAQERDDAGEVHGPPMTVANAAAGHVRLIAW